MTPPKAVVFDLGKVLVDFDYSIAGRRIAARSRVTPAEVRAFIDHSPLLVELETGRMAPEGFIAEVHARAGFEGTPEELADAFADIFSPIDAMIEAQSRLRGAGIPTFIFSNTNDIAVRHIRSRFPFFSHFDGYVLSYEEGAMKPDASIYESVERRTGLSGSDLIYIDDRLENVEAGAARRWRVIPHSDPGITLNELRRNGLSV